MKPEHEMKEKKDEQTEEKEISELEQCRAELAQWKDKYIHLAADFENFKKRELKQRTHLQFILQADMLRDVLGLIDDFERAEKQIEAVPEECQGVFKGITLISKEMDNFLKKHEVFEISQTKTFDPELHEAIARIESKDHESEDIIEVVQKGYMFKDHVLRPAKVAVAQ